MKGKKKPAIPPKAQLALAAIVPLVLLVGGWMMLVSPQRSKASSLREQIGATQDQIAAAQVAARNVPKPQPIRVADIYPLLTAMPDHQDLPGIILQLNQVAVDSGISFKSIAPGAVSAGNGYQTQAFALQFEGDFYALSDFLYRLRNLVSVRGGRLAASGRLFSIENVALSESGLTFPQISASITVDGYMYGNAVPVPGATTPTTAPPTDTTGSSTTTTTTATDTTASGATTTGVSG